MIRKGGRATMIALAVAGTLVAGVVTGCGGTAAPDPRSPRGYLDHALRLFEQHAIYLPALDWNAVSGHARKLAAGAKTPKGTYPAIRYVVGQLQNAGDAHAAFLEAARARQYAPGAPSLEAPTKPPTVSILNRRLGLIKVPSVVSSPRSANSRRYVSAALTAIRRLDARRDPCGWVVDLRDDGGGDMYPMLLSVGPIVGEGHLIGFTGKRGFLHFVSYRRGVLSGGGFTDRAPLTVPDLEPPPPVAVLIGDQTASSGEVVAVAFRGRSQARSFGSQTYGATTVAASYHLIDGAELVMGGSYYVDRDSLVYKQALKPEVEVSMLGSGDPQMRAAAAWLLARPGCTHAP